MSRPGFIHFQRSSYLKNAVFILKILLASAKAAFILKPVPASHNRKNICSLPFLKLNNLNLLQLILIALQLLQISYHYFDQATSYVMDSFHGSELQTLLNSWLSLSNPRVRDYETP